MSFIQRLYPLRFQARRLCNARALVRFAVSIIHAHIHAVQFCAVSVLFAVLAGLGFFLRLSQGPIEVSILIPPLEEGLRQELAAAGLGADLKSSIGRVALENTGKGLAFTFYKILVSNEAGALVFAAPKAEIALDPLSLLRGHLNLRRIDFIGLQIHAVVASSGALSFNVTDGDSEPKPSGSFVIATAQEDNLKDQQAQKPQFAALNTLVHGLLDHLTRNQRVAQGTIGTLEHVGLLEGQLDVEEPDAGQVLRYSGITLGYEKTQGDVRLSLSGQNSQSALGEGLDAKQYSKIDGADTGYWQILARASLTHADEPDFDGQNPYRLDFAVRNFSSADAITLLGLDKVPLDIMGALDVRLVLLANKAGSAGRASGFADVSQGYYRLTDKDSEPFLFDAAHIAFHYQAADRNIILDEGRFDAPTTHMRFSGNLGLPTAASDVPMQADKDSMWRIHLTTSHFDSGLEWADDEPLSLDKGVLDARFDGVAKTLFLDRFALNGPVLDASFAGNVKLAGDDPHAQGTLQLANTSLKALRHIWPSFINGDLRNWFCQSIRGGMLDFATLALDFGQDAFAAARDHTAMPDGALALDFRVHEGKFHIADTMPDLIAITAQGHITGRTATIDLPKSGMADASRNLLAFSAARFVVDDTAPRPLIPAHIVGKAKGTLATLSHILAYPCFKAYAIPALGQDTVHGDIEGALSFELVLGEAAKPDMNSFAVEASISNLAIDRLWRGAKLEDGALALSADPHGFSGMGEGRFLGAGVTFSLEKSGNGEGWLNADLTLDQGLREKLGLDLGAALSGAIPVHISANLDRLAAGEARIEADLTKAAINNPVPGVSKPQGRAGKLAFETQRRPTGETVLSKVALDFGSVSARGQMELDGSGALAAAKFAPLRLSAGDDLQLMASRGADGLKLSLTGSSVDARAYIKSFAAGTNRSHALDSLDLDCAFTAITGFGDTPMMNFALHYVRRSDKIASLFGTAQLGKPITLAFEHAVDEDDGHVRIISQNAGALLQFLDLYPHMEGGALDFSVRNDGARLAGAFTIVDFTLLQEPMLRSVLGQTTASGTNGLATAAPQAAHDGQRLQAVPAFNPDEVRFNHFAAQFLRQGGRIDVENAAISGAELGATLRGHLDFGRDNLDISGTLVPAFALNNAFSSLPLLGMLLGGGREEGLFALNYRITGAISKPKIEVNPLSALTPGVLRTMLGAFDGTNPVRDPVPDLKKHELQAAPANN